MRLCTASASATYPVSISDAQPHANLFSEEKKFFEKDFNVGVGVSSAGRLKLQAEKATSAMIMVKAKMRSLYEVLNIKYVYFNKFARNPIKKWSDCRGLYVVKFSDLKSLCLNMRHYGQSQEVSALINRRTN